MIYWIVGGALGVGLVWRLLAAVTAQGGRRSGDAVEIAGPVVDEAAVFRGDDPENREPWDGGRRLNTKTNIFGF